MKVDVIRRGEWAERCLNDETMMGALQAVTDELAQQWLASRPDDTAGRESAFRMAKSVELIRLKLEAWKGEAQTERHIADQRLKDAT